MKTISRVAGLSGAAAMGLAAPAMAAAIQLQTPERLEQQILEEAVSELMAEPADEIDADSDLQMRVYKIVNGLRTVEFAEVGSVLMGQGAENASQWCTGTLIASDYVLTAAHCVADDPDPDLYHVYFQHAGVIPVAEVDWQENLYAFPNADVALLRLARPVTGIGPADINYEVTPAEQDLSLIVGFGRTGGNKVDYGIKRVGAVVIDACNTPFDETDLICWVYDDIILAPGTDSNTCNADSGGPLFWPEVVMPRVVSGVTSGGSRGDCLSTDYSYDVSVYHHSTWIRSVVGAGLAQPAAGLPLVGGPDATVRAQDSRLTPATDRIRWTFDIQRPAQVLRVALNGEDDGAFGIDFDLNVYRLAGDGSRTLECGVAHPSQFAACEFDQPAPGVWEVEVVRQYGEGLAQVVVTQFH